MSISKRLISRLIKERASYFLTKRRSFKPIQHLIHTYLSLGRASSHELSMSSTRPVEPGGKGNLFHLALDYDSIENDLAIFFSWYERSS